MPYHLRLVTVERGRTRYRRVRRPAPAPTGQLSLFGPARVHALPVRGGRTPARPFEHAVTLDLAGDAGAGEAYRAAIEAGDRAADAWCNLGVLAARDAAESEVAFAEAVGAFAEALALEPGHAGAHFDLGCLYLARAEAAPARVHFRVASAAAGEAAGEAALNLAIACAMLGDASAAGAALAQYEATAPADDAGAAGALVRRLLGQRAAR